MVTKKTLAPQTEKLRDYELILIINPEVVEEKCSALADSVTQSITEKGGEVSETEQWGKRKLAYPLKHFMEGNYVLMRVKMMPKMTKELNENLQISEDVLRHLLAKIGD
jgi:small subunit ribosomal protein S6